MNQEKQFETSSKDSRKAYHTPRLEDYGDVRDLTQTSIIIDFYSDGGLEFPNMYSSVPL